MEGTPLHADSSSGRFELGSGAALGLVTLLWAGCGEDSTALDAGGSPARGAAEAQAAGNTATDASASGVPAAPLEAETTSSAWPIFRGDPGLGGVASGTLPDKPELLWSFLAGADVTSSPVVVDGRVYFGSDDANVYCLDAETGEELWTYLTEDILEAPPLVVDGTLYIGSMDFFFYALDAETGELRWKFETDDQIVGGANFHRAGDGLRIVVGSHDSNLYCFGAETGELLWSYSTDNFVNATPAIDRGRAIFGGCDAVLHMVSIESGERVGRVELGPDCHVAGSVAIGDGRAYFGHYGNRFVCIDLESQEVLWEYGQKRFPFFSSPALGEELVVFGGRDRSLHCVRREDGEPVWTFPTRNKVDGSPVIVGDRVVFGSLDGRLYILDLAEGLEQWTFDIGKAIVSSPAVVDGTIYVGAGDDRLYAFGMPEESGSPKAEH